MTGDTTSQLTVQAAGTGLQYLATPAAGLRVICRVDETILAVNEEREILAFMAGGHLSDWHYADGMTLQCTTEQTDRLLMFTEK